MKRLAFLFFLVSLVRSSLLLATPAGIPVSGQVLDAAGKPVQGASVRLVPIPRSSEALTLELAGRLHPEPVSRASTDARGRFEVTAPEAGMWTVIVESPGRVSRQHPLVPLFEPLELPPVRLPDAGRLEILVVDAAGWSRAGTFSPSPITGAASITKNRWSSPLTGRSSSSYRGTEETRREAPRPLHARLAARGPPAEAEALLRPEQRSYAAGRAVMT